MVMTSSRGGNGDDLLIGGRGTDTLTGGAGVDIFGFFENNTGDNTVTDLTAGEAVALEDFGFDAIDDVAPFLSTAGNDVVFAFEDVRITFQNASLSLVTQAIEDGFNLEEDDFGFGALSDFRDDTAPASVDLSAFDFTNIA